MSRPNKIHKILSTLLIFTLLLSQSVNVLAQDSNEYIESSSQAELVYTSAIPAASGTTYGPWFGGVQNESWSNSPKVPTKVAAVILAGVGGLVSGVASGIASAAAAAIGFTNFDAREYVYGKLSKTYRQVYVAGNFSHYQTKVTISVNSNKRGYLTTVTKTFDGSMMMSISDE